MWLFLLQILSPPMCFILSLCTCTLNVMSRMKKKTSCLGLIPPNRLRALLLCLLHNTIVVVIGNTRNIPSTCVASCARACVAFKSRRSVSPDYQSTARAYRVSTCVLGPCPDRLRTRSVWRYRFFFPWSISPHPLPCLFPIFLRLSDDMNWLTSYCDRHAN